MKINEEVCLYRTLFEDNKPGYQHYADILWHIRKIKNRKDVSTLTQTEQNFRLILEIGD